MGAALRITIGAALCTVLLDMSKAVESERTLLGHFTGLWALLYVVWVVWSSFVYPHFVSPLRHLPQPKGAHWLIGHSKPVVKQGPGVAARQWIKETPNDGFIRYFWFFNRERIIVTSPKAISDVIVANSYAFEKPKMVREFLQRLIGQGILVTEGDKHKVQRRNLMPAFAFRHVKDLYPTFWSKSCEFVQAVSATCDDRGVAEIDITSWSTRCMLDLIGLAGLGLDFGALRDENNELTRSYMTMAEPNKQEQILLILSTLFPSWLLHSLPLPRNFSVAKSVNHIRSVCRHIIAERRTNKTTHDKVDILGVALKSGLFSDEILIDQLMTFLAAGHDTTTASLIWAVYALSVHQDVQDRLREEVCAHLPSVNEDSSISSIDFDRLTYLHAFCNEVLRLYSPLPQSVRDAVHDVTIQGTVIPRGTRIIISPWGTNVDTELWGDDAAELNPDRWLSVEQGGSYDKKTASSGGATSNYAFLPFSHGPHSCIGQTFARGELACTVAAWVSTFRCELVDERLKDWNNVQIEPAVTARPMEGLKIRVSIVEST